MKNNDRNRERKLADALSLAEDKYITEASPDAKIMNRSAKKKVSMRNVSPASRVLMVAAAMMLTVSIVLSAFVIPLSISNGDTSDNENDNWAQQFSKIDSNAVSAVQLNSGYQTLAEKFETYINTGDDIMNSGPWWDAEEDWVVEAPGMSGGNAADNPEGSPMPDAPTEYPDEMPETNKGESSNDTYEEITDNQTAGVIESDIIKRSSKYIYYYDYLLGTLRVYSIAERSLVGTYDLFAAENLPELYKNGYEGVTEFFLSKDCNSVIFVTNVRKSGLNSNMLHTCFILLDVSDPSNITLKNLATVSGSLVEVRYTNNSLLAITRTYFSKHNINIEDKETYVPDVNGELIPSDCIYAPEEITNSQYTTVVSLDSNTLEVKSSVTYASYYCEDIYVSDSNIYISRGLYSSNENKLYYEYQTKSEITAISYADDKLTHLGTVAVNGSVKDRFCLDEYRGVLRIAVTTEKMSYYKMGDNQISDFKHHINANLYCIRLSDFATIAEVIAFAPDGERVQSARFDGDTAYICTSVEFSDPVFFFDLSDMANITYKDTGNIEGYSSSLINFGDGYLVGIGYGSSRSVLKIEVYTESEGGVESADKYEAYASFSLDYKAYYIDRENKLIGLAVQDMYSYGYDANYEYKVFSLNEDGDLEVIDNFSFTGPTYLGYCRGVYIDGYFFVFTPNNGFAVHKLTK